MDFDKDDDFLCDFDVDAAVLQRKKKQQQQSASFSSPSTNKRSFMSPNRDQKPNPYRQQFSSPSKSPKNPYVTSSPSKSHCSGTNDLMQTSPNKRLKSYPPQATIPTSSPLMSNHPYSTSTSKTAPVSTMDNNQKQKLKASLQSTLSAYFGHTQFKPGQLQVLTNLLSPSPRDTCVFWSTGSGKSLCYQLPPLHLYLQHKQNAMALVISPLLSLIEDQVSKLNGKTTSNKEKTNIATYLSSTQPDPTMESKILQGLYRVVYITPEKLSRSSFLQNLAKMHTSSTNNTKLTLIAIDECHCVSEWGHDFRPDYQNIGSIIRSQYTEFANVPLLALTATAIPKVQEDICKSLKMKRDTMVVKQSLDRENLVIEVKSRMGGIKRLVDDLGLKDGVKRKKIPSTIIYAHTRNQVEEIAAHLLKQLSEMTDNNNNDGKTLPPIVAPYHAGLSPTQRTYIHTSFLIGQTPIIVATVAFGMGIDKTDIRRIYHYGPPKTMEEYYQQIGRAGRDGLTSKCILYINGSGDFDKYKSDYYKPKVEAAHANHDLRVEIEAEMLKSMNALREYAMNVEVCRRKSILKYYGEMDPDFGKWCGTCDVCRNRADHEDDVERDFGCVEHGGGARIILGTLKLLRNPSKSILEKVLGGGTVEEWRYNGHAFLGGRSVADVTASLMERKKVWMGKKKRPLAYFRALLPGLVSRGYVMEGTKQSNSRSGYSNTWTTYDLTPQGIEALNSANEPIMLPVPPSIREVELQEEQKRQEALSALQNAGVDLTQVPKEELENGDGEVLTALKRWHSYMDKLNRDGNTKRVDELDDLRLRIEAWRSDMAERYRMGPASVMEEHVIVKIAYMVASLRDGARVDRDALFAVGVRSGGLDDLVETLSAWMDDNKSMNQTAATANDGAKGGNGVPGASARGNSMVFPARLFKPHKSWEFAVYRPKKKTGKMAWESSYERFKAGEHPQTIAMTPENGRPIQVATVIGHIFDGITHGRPVDLSRLSSECPPPNEEEWDRLLQCETETGMDVTADPATSGADGGRFTITYFLCPIMGNAFAAKKWDERTEEEKVLFGKWCERFKWYACLRRAGYKPLFESASTDKVMMDC